MITPTAGQAALAEEVRGWLTARLALYLDRPEATIDHWTPLAEFGMDSVSALSLVGDLEDEHGLILEPTLVWDHPTVSDLVTYLTPLFARDPAVRRAESRG